MNIKTTNWDRFKSAAQTFNGIKEAFPGSNYYPKEQYQGEWGEKQRIADEQEINLRLSMPPGVYSPKDKIAIHKYMNNREPKNSLADGVDPIEVRYSKKK